MLAQAFVVVTTNSAVGTDQTGATFWAKIQTKFAQRGGNAGAGRSACSLQNRFNKVLQGEVNKFIGIMTNTLREYHSGWAMDDYFNDAKRKFLVMFGKTFRHEMVYNILKRTLPKFQINPTQIDARVKRALFFCDKDVAAPAAVTNVDVAEQPGRVVGDDGAPGVEGGTPVPAIGMCTPRPSVGKKKRRRLSTTASR